MFLFSFLSIKYIVVHFTLLSSQNTALHLAAINGHAPVVKMLLSIGEAEVTLNNDNANILDAAVKEKKSDVVMAIAENER